MSKKKVDKLAPDNAQDAKASPFSEIGVSGVTIYSGSVSDDFLPQLRGSKAIKTFKEMSESDPTIGALLYAFELIITRVDWYVESEYEDAAGEEAKMFVESILDDMSHTWESFISEVLSMFVFGWSYFEIVYKRRLGREQADASMRSKYNDGLIGIRKLAVRSQDTLDRWDIDENGGVKGLWQEPPSGGGLRYLPIQKCLHFKTKNNKGNPEGRSLLRNAYLPWYYAKNLEEIEVIACERELNGLPVVRVPSALFNASDAAAVATLNVYKKIARDIKNNEQGGLVLPSDPYDSSSDGSASNLRKIDIELLASNGTRSIDINVPINRHQRNIARTMLADFLMLGSDGKGSYALSEDKSELYLHAVESVLNNISAVLNTHLLPRLWTINGLDFEYMPKLCYGEVAPLDLKELGDYVSKLAGAGIPLAGDEDTENYLRRAAGLPELKEDALLERETQNTNQDEENTQDSVNPEDA